MKHNGLKFVVAIAVGCTAATSFAQSGLQYPGSVQPVAYDYYAPDSGAATATDKSAPPAPPAAAPAAAAPAAAPAAPDCSAAAPAAAPSCNSCGCDSCGCGTGWLWLLGDQCPLTCPDQTTKRLFENNCWLKCHNITVTGLIDAGVAARDGSRGDNFLGPDGFDDRDYEGQLNQIDTVIAKAVKPQECCWDWGFTIETIYGTDYRYPLARGLDAYDNGSPKWNTDPRNFYGLALPQAYLEFSVGTKFDYKVGHQYTLLGYEVVNPSGNFFYSHTYTFLYAYPFTQTGVVGTYTQNDYVTWNYGINEGWDNFNDTDENISYTGGVTIKSCDKKTTLAWFFQEGNEPITGVTGPDANRYVNSIVLTKNLTDRTTFVLENADGFQSRGARDGGTSSWFGLTDYLTYKVNCCWTAGLRSEWFRDTNGTRVAPVGDFDTPNGNTASVGGFEGNFYDVTLGANYKPNGNLTVRPEIRYDLFNGSDLNGVKPYLSGTSNHQWVYAVDAVVLF
ncbi:MAG TPA: outer membrane beta-barrel protein [Pirellulales bacterium]|jgi:hypothetical protein|nr:outer membrane beta-barrel protein [Pirellulales bacterium]